MNRRLPAFTLIELIIAMALSGIVIGIIYSSYMIIEKQYNLIKLRDQKISQIKNLNFMLENDFKECESIIKNLNEISLKKEGNINFIVYHFEENYIIRNKLNNLDTFWVKTKDLEANFLNQEINSKNFIDELKIELIAFDENIVFNLNKNYASDAFLNIEPTE